MTNPPAQAAIEVRNVVKRFGPVTAVDNVSFHVNPGELFFLLGPSGCGKTTMLRILAGIETQDRGAVFFDGRDAAQLPPHRRGAPMVFQNYALWPHLPVFDNVAFGLVEQRRPKREIRERVEAVLNRVGLGGLGARMPGQLSGGQQQRVVLARALVLSPTVVLLDEPLSNLDARLRAEMRHEILALHRETDITFVYVTHDQVEALSLADSLIVMDAGRIRAQGRPDALYHRPPNRFCAEFLGESNLIPGQVTAVHKDRIEVQTGFGAWRAVRGDASAPTPDPGQAVTCMVRPESLSPRASGAPSNRIDARIETVQLTGSTTSVTLQTGTTLLRATVLSEYPAAIHPGLTDTWFVDEERTVILAGDLPVRLNSLSK